MLCLHLTSASQTPSALISPAKASPEWYHPSPPAVPLHQPPGGSVLGLTLAVCDTTCSKVTDSTRAVLKVPRIISNFNLLEYEPLDGDQRQALQSPNRKLTK